MQDALAQSGVALQGDPVALAELSGGSVGGALRLSLLGGMSIYAELLTILDSHPRFDRARALKLAEAAATRGAEEKLALLFHMVDLLLARLARTGATGAPPAPATPSEPALLTRLSPSPHQGRVWADLAQEISARAGHGLAVNLDPTALVLDTLLKIAHAAPRG